MGLTITFKNGHVHGSPIILCGIQRVRGIGREIIKNLEPPTNKLPNTETSHNKGIQISVLNNGIYHTNMYNLNLTSKNRESQSFFVSPNIFRYSEVLL